MKPIMHILAAAAALASPEMATAQMTPIRVADVVHGEVAAPSGLTIFKGVDGHLVVTANGVSEILDHRALTSGAEVARADFIVGGHTFTVTRRGICIFEAILEGESEKTKVEGLDCGYPAVSITSAAGLGGVPSAILRATGLDPVPMNGFCEGTMAGFKDGGVDVKRMLSTATVSLPSGHKVVVDDVCVSEGRTPDLAVGGDVVAAADGAASCAYPRLAAHFSEERWAYWAKEDGLAPAFAPDHRLQVVKAICSSEPTFMDRDALTANGPWYSSTLKGVKTMDGWRIEVPGQVFYAIPKPIKCAGACVTFSEEVPTHGHFGTPPKKAAKKPSEEKGGDEAKEEDKPEEPAAKAPAESAVGGGRLSFRSICRKGRCG